MNGNKIGLEQFTSLRKIALLKKIIRIHNANKVTLLHCFDLQPSLSNNLIFASKENE